MSQASKHIDWCLKKAQEEIEECKHLGKKFKHRGLFKVEASLEEAKKHIIKAEHNLVVTEYLVKGGFTDASIGTIFYTMYQCFLAIAAKFGYSSGNQTCTITFIKYLQYQDENKESVIEMREDSTYGTELEVDKSRIDFLIRESKELIEATKQIIYR